LCFQLGENPTFYSYIVVFFSTNFHAINGTEMAVARSSDGGRTYRGARRLSGRLVAAPPFRYRPDLGMRGVFAPSNIVRGHDSAYYALVRVRDLSGRQGVCAMRTPRSTRLRTPR